MKQSAEVVKQIDQAKLHAGIRYQWNESPTAALTASTGEILLLVTTPVASATFQAASLRISGNCQAVSRLQFFSSTTRTGGTGRTPTNLSGLSTAVAQVTIASGPTGGADGTNLEEFYVGVNDFQGTEYILAPNTKYLVRLLNHTASATNFATLRLDFYEITKLDQIQ